MRRTLIKHQGSKIEYKSQEAVKLFGIILWWKDIFVEVSKQEKNLVVFTVSQFDTEDEAKGYFAKMNNGEKEIVNVFDKD
jgi:hypothetical protein